MEYTKGKWKYEKSYRYHNVINESGGTIVQCGTLEESEANAHLIAAAPAMYEALKQLALVCRDVSYTHTELVSARKALAQADGK